MEEKTSENPFASPLVAEAVAIPEADPHADSIEYSFGKSLGKWILVCGISAAPSFFLSFILGDRILLQSIAMVMGILTWVGLYVYVESWEWTRQRLKSKSLRIAVKTGYITRVAISILFPVALYLDMICGLISVGLMDNVFDGQFEPMRLREDDPRVVGSATVFGFFYLTTLLQGLLLNLVLGAYTLVVYAIVLVARSVNR